MTKSEREAANTLREALADAQKYLDSGRIGEGTDWVRIAGRIINKLLKSPGSA